MKAITLAVAVCLTSMSALAGVGIQDIRVVAKGQICIVFEADYTSDIVSNQLPLLRSYPLVENQRAVSSSYGPFALGIPGQHTVTGIVKKKRGEGREALDGLHVGLYQVAGEKMIASLRVPYEREWSIPKQLADHEEAEIHGVSILYEADNSLVVMVDYTYRGEGFCNASLHARVLDRTEGGQIGYRPQTVYPGRHQNRIEISFNDDQEVTEISSKQIEIEILHFDNRMPHELASQVFDLTKTWISHPQGHNNHLSCAEAWLGD